MNDKELLELAAKAAGWTGWQSKHGYWNTLSPDGIARVCCEGWPEYDSETGEKLRVPTLADAIAEVNWNPLTDDGDALRLAVKLHIDIENNLSFTATVWYDMDKSETNTSEVGYSFPEDAGAATRRAITQAAAEIGKASA